MKQFPLEKIITFLIELLFLCLNDFVIVQKVKKVRKDKYGCTIFVKLENQRNMICQG